SPSGGPTTPRSPGRRWSRPSWTWCGPDWAPTWARPTGVTAGLRRRSPSSAAGRVPDRRVDVGEHGLAGARATERPEADLEVRASRDTDDPVADDGDLLTGDHLVPDVDEVGPGVAVVDGLACQRARGDPQHGGVRPEAADPLLDDGAGAHGVQRGASGAGVVDALVDRAVFQVLD